MLKKNLFANYLGQGWNALMGLAFIPLYIKYLGLEAYGLIGVFAMLQAWLGLLDMGMSPSLGRQMARFTGGGNSAQSIRDLLRSIELIAVGIAILIAGGVALCANWIATSWLKADALPIADVTQAFTIMGLVTALRFVEGVYRSAIVGLQRQILFNTINSALSTLRGLGALGILAWVSPTIEAFFIWQGMISILAIFCFSIATYTILPNGDHVARFSINAVFEIRRFAGGIVLANLLSLFQTQTDKILLSKLLSLNEFASYSLAGSVGAWLYIIVAPITAAFSPRMNELYVRGDNAALIVNYHKSAQLVTVIAGSSAIVLFFFSETFLTLWTQDRTLALNVAPLLSLLVLGTLLSTMMNAVPNPIALVYGWTNFGVLTNIISILFIVPSILWVVPKYGAVGAAYIWIVMNVGFCSIGIFFLHSRILKAEKWSWYIQDVLLPLVSCGIGVSFFSHFWPAQQTTLGQILVLLIATVFAFIISILAAPQIRCEVYRQLSRTIANYKVFFPIK